MIFKARRKAVFENVYLDLRCAWNCRTVILTSMLITFIFGEHSFQEPLLKPEGSLSNEIS